MSQYLIGTVTVGASGQSTIDISSIPGTFTDLLIQVSARLSNSTWATDAPFTFNGSTTGYTEKMLYTDSTSGVQSYSTNNAGIGWFTLPGATATANVFGNSTVYIPNYAGSGNKAISIDKVTENNASNASLAWDAAVWANSAAINRITITAPSGNTLVSGSTVSVYGIKNLPASIAKASGGAITYDANYVYHAFTGSGTFTPTTALSNVEYVVIAGGGGGGYQQGGGGGAGGYRAAVTGELSGGGASAEAKLSLTSGTPYTVTIGAGGAGSTSSGTGANGSNTVFGSITATGGGRGGTTQPAGNRAGLTGGSGGGIGPLNIGDNFAAAAGTSGQGFAGGAANATTDYTTGSGGGGAGGAGVSMSSGNYYLAGAGGAGVTSSITGTAVARAGGGGGGAYYNGGTGVGGTGVAGGGAGTNNGTTGGAGTANTGGGGGGGGQFDPPFGIGGNGGSGIVIIRYAR